MSVIMIMGITITPCRRRSVGVRDASIHIVGVAVIMRVRMVTSPTIGINSHCVCVSIGRTPLVHMPMGMSMGTSITASRRRSVGRRAASIRIVVVAVVMLVLVVATSGDSTRLGIPTPSIVPVCVLVEVVAISRRRLFDVDTVLHPTSGFSLARHGRIQNFGAFQMLHQGNLLGLWHGIVDDTARLQHGSLSLGTHVDKGLHQRFHLSTARSTLQQSFLC